MENIFDKMVSTFEKGDNQFDINPTFKKDEEKGLFYFELKGFNIYGWNSIESYMASDPQQTPFMRLIPDENKEFYKGYKNSISMSLYERGEMSLGIFETRILYPLFYNLVSYDIDFAETLLSIVDDLDWEQRKIALKQLFKLVIINRKLPDLITLQFESDTDRIRFKDTLRYFKFGIQHRIKTAKEQNGYSRSGITSLKDKDFPIFDLSTDQAKEYETRKAQLEMLTTSTPSKIRLNSKAKKDSKATKADLHRVIIAMFQMGFFENSDGSKIELIHVERAFQTLLGLEDFDRHERKRFAEAEKGENDETFSKLREALIQFGTEYKKRQRTTKKDNKD